MRDADMESGAQRHGRVGSVINGKWQIDARVGAGGMAAVYAATHRNGSRAALKILHAPLSIDPQVRARFLREGRVANSVGHPGVVPVLDDGVTEDGAAFLVLELLEGETVEARRLRLGGVLPIDEALDVAEASLDVLAAAHARGVIHRDVKPENVFFTKEREIKLLDFGLARLKDGQDATQTGVRIGTPEFMSPEQAGGRRDAVDARSDVWGVGAMLFTMITGRFVHETAQSLREQLLVNATQRPRSILDVMPDVPPAVAVVIDRALELERSDRWQSARDMQLGLRAARASRERAHATDDALGSGLWESPTVVSERRPPVLLPSPAPTADGPAFDEAVDCETTVVDRGQAAPPEPNPLPSRPSPASVAKDAGVE
ncbi:MAG TPA: serine/threonine-protein kinase, partial [Labilithrix sp.]|nr:serine/threonine-protein kinase [Labilithrix sp.]